MADQTRNTPSPATSRAAPAIRVSTARGDRHPRAGPSATDARRRRISLPKGSRQCSENLTADRARLSRRSVIWSTMRPTPMAARRGGPFLVPARWVLLVSGLMRAGAFAVLDCGGASPSHVESGAGALGTLVKSEGLPVATVAMALLCACVLTVVSAAVLWGNPRGRDRRLESLPLFLGAVAGAVLVILQATDGVHRDSFGSSNTEDGAFAAAVTASLWLLGGLWIARVRRVGALIIMLATFIVWYSFITLHLLKGGIPLSQVAAKSGVAWAVLSASAAIVAAASFLTALALFAVAVLQRRRTTSARAAPAPRRASGCPTSKGKGPPAPSFVYGALAPDGRRRRPPAVAGRLAPHRHRHGRPAVAPATATQPGQSRRGRGRSRPAGDRQHPVRSQPCRPVRQDRGPATQHRNDQPEPPPRARSSLPVLPGLRAGYGRREIPIRIADPLRPRLPDGAGLRRQLLGFG